MSPQGRQFVLIGGGARSGKSAFALSMAQRLGSRRIFVATAQGLDDEMRARIDRHRQERPTSFTTMEEPLALAAVLDTIVQADVVLIDCLTLWLSNLLVSEVPVETVVHKIDELGAAIARRRFHVVLVTNEVGLGLVPETALGRNFRDVVGQAHQRLSVNADQIYAALLGQILRLRPGPVELTGDLGAP
ncbi:MAG TPA: bifunctional adenosylcobinamide kinase/adenosylcobinamide-phosphate guanylyltransferase [Polyangia bacterium]|jgi:adenosylcobinamide kinase/adenosylcobinamide-phosphate guanylyltransferase|nr:bifunctional adenosylcobinamide kinase/adenosylcobinamide-phosphate guanylyltransferase [Polyangia bacterium]